MDDPSRGDEVGGEEDACTVEEALTPLGPLELTDRDLAVFKMAHEQRYLVHNQIKAAFWPDRSEPAKACYHRVTRLLKSGFLAQRYSRRKNMQVYHITEMALAELKARGVDGGLVAWKPTEYLDKYIDHDLKVTNIRIVFRGLGLDTWTSERLLKERDHVRQIPDGVLNLYGKKAAIELENHLSKSKIRYQKLMHDYRQSGDYYFVFIIIHGDAKDWLIDLDYDARQVWFMTYKEFLNKRENTLLENKRSRFILGRLL